MEIPDYFCAKAARTFGVEGEHWLRHLPEIIARCKDRWQLSICTPFHKLSINLVGTAQSAAYGDVVLKNRRLPCRTTLRNPGPTTSTP